MSLEIDYFKDKPYITKVKDEELYFINQKHITDLQKFKDEVLYFIIRQFRYELKKFNESEEFKLQGLNTACNEMRGLIEEFRFILNGYLELINNHNIPDGCYKIIEIKELLTEMDKIENILDKIRTVRLLKEKVDELADKCIYKMRIFYDSLSDFIYGEFYFWKNLI